CFYSPLLSTCIISIFLPYTTLFRSPKQSEQPSFELNRSDFVKVNETNTNPNIPEHVAYEDVEDSIEVADLAHIEKSEPAHDMNRSEEHTSELQSRFDLVCRLLLEKK